MKILFSVVMLVLLSLCARAANPSFLSFDTNFFQVSGTGNNSIKIKTNAFTWLNASPFVLSNGTISNTVSSTVSNGVFGSSVMLGDMMLFSFQEFGTNRLRVTSDGTLRIGSENNSSTLSAEATLVSLRKNTKGDPDGQRIFLMNDNRDADSQTYRTWLDLSAVPSPNGGTVFGDFYSLNTNGVDSEVFFQAKPFGTTKFYLLHNGSTRTLFNPTIADGSTPYVLDTSTNHTSGNLLEVRNAGTNTWTTDPFGGGFSGRYARDWWGGDSDGSIVVIRDTAKGDNGIDVEWVGGDLAGTNATFDFLGDDATARFRIRFGTTMVSLEPTADPSLSPYLFNTAFNHTSGYLLEVKNAGVNAAGITFSGGLAGGGLAGGTTSITSSGIGAIAWGSTSANGDILASGNGSIALGRAEQNNSRIVASGKGSLAGGFSDDGFEDVGVISAEGTAGFTWGYHVQNSANVALVFGSGFSNSTPNSVTFGWVTGPTVQITQGLLQPMVSNAFDIGTSLLPIRTNYAKAFTVVGSQRTVAYSESGTIYLDADAIRLRGNLPATTNLSIAGVATLNITNGLIMAISGP